MVPVGLRYWRFRDNFLLPNLPPWNITIHRDATRNYERPLDQHRSGNRHPVQAVTMEASVQNGDGDEPDLNDRHGNRDESDRLAARWGIAPNMVVDSP